ncbi:MAG: hypothetical protein IIX42_00665 [Alistipes sp.]|nr:hypothetical protein [Alistipes sp.]
MVTLTAGEIHAIAIQLYKEIEGSHYQHISAGISAKTTELSVSAIYDGAEVFIEDYKCIDEDCNSLSVVESDLEKIEEIINNKIV